MENTNKIWFCSDLHLGHDKQFIWGPRGYGSVYEQDADIVAKWNATVSAKDDVYVLGDLMLGDNEAGLRKIKSLKGRIHIILGNHDSNTRKKLYESCYNVVEVVYAMPLTYKGYNFFLTHYPCMTGNFGGDSLKHTLCNLFGHTHSKEKFYEEMPWMYNVAWDAHLGLVSIDNIIADMEKQATNCKKFL